MRYYTFDPTDIYAYVGWSLKAAYGSLGKPVSSNIDLYSHLNWRDYIDKLMTPLNEIFDR